MLQKEHNFAFRRTIRAAVRSKFAWPGGYPLYLVMMDGESLCMDCARQEYRQIAEAHYHDKRGSWSSIGADVNWEDNFLFCSHCNTRIESAYAED